MSDLLALEIGAASGLRNISPQLVPEMLMMVSPTNKDLSVVFKEDPLLLNHKLDGLRVNVNHPFIDGSFHVICRTHKFHEVYWLSAAS